MLQLTIWGAARQVTGSMHLVEAGKYKILIDCGLDYEKTTGPEENAQFPFDPESIDVVILTHAHIDHSGNLPTLVRLGFEGQIISTSATAELTELLLIDSVNIFLGKDRKRSKGRRGHSRSKPLYLHKHVMDTMARFVTIPFEKPFRLNGDIELTLVPAGHLLGAAFAVLKINDGGTEKTIAFTGDVGRQNYPVLVSPGQLPPLDYLVCESTYGGRLHTTGKTIEQALVEFIEEACIKNPGRMIIPAFSIGRTQALVYSLNRIFSQKLLPPVKVFVDSPLANLATDVYRKFHHLVNDEAREFYSREGDEFEFENLYYTQDLKESRQIGSYQEPCIIVSSAGMLEGGRIQDHLFYNIQNYYCTILFIGYSAKGTLGHRLLRGDPVVHIRDRELSVYATIRQTDLLSGHADQQDLLNLIAGQDISKIKKVFLVHGEPESMVMLQSKLSENGYTAVIPEKGQVFAL